MMAARPTIAMPQPLAVSPRVASRLLSMGNGDVLTVFLFAPGFLLLWEAKTSNPPQAVEAYWAYVWLLGAMAMMPLFPAYSLWTNQVFAHAYWGAHRHAFTVGFVSLMIVGVSSRVVPILAGLDPSRISRLWGPFLMLNVGCAGRVVLQILTDFAPKVAYALIGFTGFIELGALAWWGIELWAAMNLAKQRKLPPIGIRMPLPAR